MQRTRSCGGFFAVFLAIIPGVVVADSSGADLGKAVGISVATSIATTLATLGVVYLIRRFTTKKNRLKRESVERNSTQSANSTRSNASSTRPLAGHLYSPVQTSDVNGGVGEDGDAYKRRSRIKSDFIAKWCTENKLTEQTATVLRDNGFTYPEAIQSLKAQDIARLRLQNTAQECLLRDIVARKNAPPPLATSSSGCLRQRSTSEEALPSPSGRSDHNNSKSSGSGVLERSGSQSLDYTDGTIGKPLASIRKRSMGSMEIIEDDEAGQTITIIRSTKKINDTPSLVVHKGQTRKENPREFKGLLSDKGLWDLCRMLGAEWSHLAALLGVPKSVQEQIIMDNPSNTIKQIYEMLRMWRDSCRGSKEQIKGQLHKALVKCDRTDLAEDLLLEQVEGSAEKVAYHSII